MIQFRKVLFLTIITILLFAQNCQLAWAQDYLIENFNVSNGLPNNCIQQIMCSRNGLMWFATGEGLCRYDGHEFKTVEFQGVDNVGCEVWSVLEDTNGFLWLIIGNDLYKANLEKGTAQKISFTDAGINYDKSVSKMKKLKKTPDGKIWLGFSDNSIIYINPEDDSMSQIKTRPASWTYDKAGAIYYLTDNQDIYISRDNFSTSEYLLSLDSYGNFEQITYIDGHLFLSAPDIIFSLNLSTREYSRFYWNNLNSIKQLQNGLICASTNNGVYIIDKGFNELLHFSTSNNGPAKLIDNIIRMVCEDQNGGI